MDTERGELQNELKYMMQEHGILEHELVEASKKLDLAQRREEHYKRVKQINEQLNSDYLKLE